MSQAADPAASPPPALPLANHGVITISVMLATVMQTLDSTIANVALPRMQGELSATQDQMGWVLTSYIVASAIAIPLSGWLANEFGRRRVFLVSIFLFTTTSLLCGLAQNLPELVLFRCLQGVGGAALVPLSQAVLFDINAPKDFGKAMGLWAGCSQAGTIIGPALGGWLTESLSWRWVFFINLPVGLLAFAGLLLTMPERRNAQRSRFDFFGFATLSLGVAGLQVMLDRGQLLDWFSSPEIIIEAIVSGLGFYLFTVQMLTYDHPFLKAALFRDRNFMVCCIFIFLIGLVLYATLALLPAMLQDELHYPVVTAGLVTAPRGFGTLIGVLIAGRLINRMDGRLMIVCGLVLVAFGLWQMTHYSLMMGAQPVIMAGLSQGIGISLVYLPLATLAFMTLPAGLRNEGATLFSLVRNIGSSLGISVVLFMLTQNMQRLHASIGEHITRYNMSANLAAIAGHVDAGSTAGLARLNATIGDQGAMIAYIDDFKMMMVLTILVLPAVLLIKKARSPAQPGAAAAVME